ncbi:hypothetical protein WJ92_15150 [Burkholderia ubonensis]|nr:hypothetical protein WJ92_15150 [Burkholderia ubonensis]
MMRAADRMDSRTSTADAVPATPEVVRVCLVCRVEVDRQGGGPGSICIPEMRDVSIGIEAKEYIVARDVLRQPSVLEAALNDQFYITETAKVV